MVRVCTEMSASEGWGTSALETPSEFCPAWRRESSRETLQHLKGLQGSWKGTVNEGMEQQDKGNGFKMMEGRDRLDIGRKFFPVRVEGPWHRFSRKSHSGPGVEP